jgi:hypothetical protein
VTARGDELAACYRGHPILDGQDLLFDVDPSGAITRIDARIWCPIDAAVVRCMQRVLAPLEPFATNGEPGRIRISVSRASR